MTEVSVTEKIIQNNEVVKKNSNLIWTFVKYNFKFPCFVDILTDCTLQKSELNSFRLWRQTHALFKDRILPR